MQPPADDEVEITLFGRGVGECVVAHILDGRWIIVDSFVHYKSEPVAEWYLDQLGVTSSDVAAIVVTHFHEDHYRGVRRLYDRYTDARLFYTEVWGREQFGKILGGSSQVGKGVHELAGTLEHAVGRRLSDGHTTRREPIRVGSIVDIDGTRLIRAIAPTSAAAEQSDIEIGVALRQGWNAVRTHLRDDNRCSVALHLSLDGVEALLAADVVDHPAQFGWAAILSDGRHATLPPVSYVKAPHHGSDTADHTKGWGALTDGAPVISIAPCSSSKIPRIADLTRLAGLGREIWLAAPSGDGNPHERAEALEEGISASSPRGKIGYVRSRRRVGEDRWITKAFGAANEVVR